MAGALAERAFAAKIHRMGFQDVRILDRTPFDLDRVSLYPLFTPEVLAIMRRTLPEERQACVAVSVIVTAVRG